MVNVLVVDDDKDFLKIVQKVLEHGGYSVVCATDAMGALEQLAREVFDLVLSDANMPGPSGFDLVKTMRKHPLTANIPIAFLTGRRDKSDIYKGIQVGADDYIVKPIDPDLFLDKIATLLKAREMEPKPEINFAEGAVHMTAKWEASTEITSISERGLTMRSPISAAMNSKFKIESPLFEQLQITPPNMRVVKCVADETEPHMHFTTVSFVGLTDTERQKIRYWINTNIGLMKQKKAAA